MMKIIFKKNSKKQWSWRAVAANGRSIAWSGETYKTRAGASKGLDSLIKSVKKGEYKVIN